MWEESMSGHSKWAQIKRQKGAADARRGQLFTKLSREIVVAARHGGANPEFNARLRLAVQKARDSNMPAEGIERALKRGAGEGEGTTFSEAVYEGYGAGGAAILVEVLTDNRNRTTAEVRNAFSRGNGTLGESGCVKWLFEPRGVITVESEDTEEVALLVVDAGAEDVKIDDGSLEVYTRPEGLEEVRQALEDREVSPSSADVLMVPSTTVMLDEREALQTLRLLDRLEELDDVQRVFTNADFPQEALEKYRSAG